MESTSSHYEQSHQLRLRNDLILSHLDYVAQVLDTIRVRLPDQVDTENLQSAGVVGLIEAAHHYDPSRGVAFKTFAFPRIRGAIIDELRRNSPFSQKMLADIRRVRETLERLPPPVTPEQLGRALGLPLARIEEILEAMRLANPQPWDEKVHDPNRLEQPHSPVDAGLQLDERRRALAAGIERLPERERLALTLYYLEGLRLKEIGLVLKITESRASKLLASAELRLREFCRQAGS